MIKFFRWWMGWVGHKEHLGEKSIAFMVLIGIP
jgi:hypothetical protein